VITELHARLKKELHKLVSVELGPEELNRQAVPPRMVLMPGADTFVPYDSKSTTPERLEGKTAPTTTTRPPYSRLAGFRLHIWGRDYSATDALIRHAVAALRKIVGSGLELYPSGYSGDDASEGAVSAAGKREYELNFRVYQELGAETPETLVLLERVILDEKEILEQLPQP
jgi:hypothetical protein